MFCDACGSAVQAGQSFCNKCGKQIAASMAAGPVAIVQRSTGRVQAHAQLLGILWFAFSAFNAVGGFVLLLLGGVLFPHLRELKGIPPDVPVGFLTSLFSALGIFIVAKAAVGFIAGWGLVQRAAWARVFALVMAFISLFNIPFGTAIGVYTLWVLLPARSQEEFDALVAARAA